MISILIVVRDAEDFIAKCINSIIIQFNKEDKWELILVDSICTDKTIEIASKVLESNSVNFRIIKNPQLILATGWNLGVNNAHYDYVLRPDAHSELEAGYIKNALSILKIDKSLGAVGGVIHTESNSKTGNLISLILSNPIGVGNSKFRIGVKENTYTRTVVYGVYRKKVFLEAGGLNNKLKRNQDIDLHNNILINGYKLLTSPDLVAKYYNRSSVQQFLKQAFNNGYWITKGHTRHLNHLIPLAFVLAIVLSLIISLKIVTAIYIFHFLACFYSYIIFSNVHNPLKLFTLQIMTFIFHMTYGIGSIWGILRRLKK